MGNLKVLIAEDSPIVMATLKKNFENLSCTVITALNGQESVEKFNAEIDLVVMDYLMPIMKGDEAVKLIRQAEKKSPNIKQPVFILGQTAISSADISQILLASGVDKVITKPVQMDVIQDVIEKLQKRQY